MRASFSYLLTLSSSLSLWPPHFLLPHSLFFPAKEDLTYFIIMTNNTKQRTSNVTHHSDDHLPASGSDEGNLTLEELREQNKELERRLRKYKGFFFLLSFIFKNPNLNNLNVYYR